MATRTIGNAGGNWTVNGTWVEGVAPTAADDVVATGTSGNVTINSGAVCRSADFTGYVATLTHTSGVALTIGDASGGSLKLVAGMTYTPNANSMSISFVSTTTGNTIDMGGKSSGNLTFNGVGGGWTLTGAITSVAVSTTITLTSGALDTNGRAVTYGTFTASGAVARSLTMGASAWTLQGNSTVWDITTATNLTFDAGTSSITLSGNSVTFIGGSKTYNSIVFTSVGFSTITAVTQCASLTRTGTAAKNDDLLVSNDMIITALLNITGNSSSNRTYFRSSVLGTVRTLTTTGATVTCANADFRDITLSVAKDLSAISGGSGDGGGNSGITFTTPANKYWVANAGNWSDATNHWAASSNGSPGTANYPLVQDTAIFDASSITIASQTVTMDEPRVGSISFSAVANSPTFAMSTASQEIYGSLTLASAMTFTLSQVLTHVGRSSYTLMSAGKTFASGLTLTMIGGTLTLQDALSLSAVLTINNGTFTANNFNVTATFLNSLSATARTINMGSGTWTLTSTGTIWNTSTTTNLTFNAGTSTILFSDTSASSKTFSGGGLTFNRLSLTGGGSGAVIIIGSNTFGDLFQIIDGTKTIQFTAGTTTTFTGGTSFGNGSNVITISSVTAATHTVTKASGIIRGNYLSLTNSIAAGGAAWYAGESSTNGGGNTGWIFGAAPPVGSASLAFSLGLSIMLSLLFFFTFHLFFN